MSQKLFLYVFFTINMCERCFVNVCFVFLSVEVHLPHYLSTILRYMYFTWVFQASLYFYSTTSQRKLLYFLCTVSPVVLVFLFYQIFTTWLSWTKEFLIILSQCLQKIRVFKKIMLIVRFIFNFLFVLFLLKEYIITF